MTISYSDFKQLPVKQQKETLETLRNDIGISALIQSWGISRSKIYNVIHDLGLSVSVKKDSSKQNKAESPKNTKKKQSLSQQNYNNEMENPTEFNTNDKIPSQLPFSVSLVAQGSYQDISENLPVLFQHNFFPHTNVRVTVNIDEI